MYNHVAKTSCFKWRKNPTTEKRGEICVTLMACLPVDLPSPWAAAIEIIKLSEHRETWFVCTVCTPHPHPSPAEAKLKFLANL